MSSQNVCSEEGLLFSVDVKQLSNHKTIIHDIMKFTYRVIIVFMQKGIYEVT